MAKSPARKAAAPAPPAPPVAIQAVAEPLDATPALPVQSVNVSAPFPAFDPALLTHHDVKRLDFGALISLGLEAIESMDEGMTKSGVISDARQHLIKARVLVDGFQSGRIF